MGMSAPHPPTIEQRIAATRYPDGKRPVMYQRWAHLLFLHWRVPPELIQKDLPDGLFVDTWEGDAWLGIVPFFMQRVRPRFCPAVPGLSDFLELNLRTYVHDRHGRPGVWFYSLDANQALAVRIARTRFSLPYVFAGMRAKMDAHTGVHFHSRRPGGEEQAFVYRKGKHIGIAQPGSLEFFLVERYHLFSFRKRAKRVYIGQVHHTPYPLYTTEVTGASRGLFSLNGFADPGRDADHALMAPSVEVTIFGMQRIG